MTNTPFIFGTRGSRLALAQTEMVKHGLMQAHPDVAFTHEVIKTSGDWKPEDGERRLAEAEGGKGLFVKEIEQALIDGRICAGVHSMKDVPSFLPAGLVVDHVLPRGDARDILVTRDGDDLMTLPSGSAVGTSSLRRQAIIKKMRPDLVVAALRGNVPTRLEKLRTGQVDAIVLAYAGVLRLGVESLPLGGLRTTLLEPALMLPACGQGIVCIETRQSDTEIRSLLDKIHDEQTGLCAHVERRILQILDGSCHTPIGAYAEWLNDGRLFVRAMVAQPDGSESYQSERTEIVKTIADAQRVAEDLGHEVRANAPLGILPVCRTGT